MSLQQSILPTLPESAIQPLRRPTPTKVIPAHPIYRTTYQTTHGAAATPITYQSSLADTIQSAREMRDTLVETELSRSQAYNVPERLYLSPNHRSSRSNREFFETGFQQLSANGDAAAQCYFHKVRPLEGSPHISYPSKTHVMGHAFFG